MKIVSYKISAIALALSCLIGLTACNDNNDSSTSNTKPTTPTDTRDQRFLNAKVGDVIQVSIADMIPTQGAVGYDQVYYKLGRWQGDVNRPTWQADPANQLVYLNKTIGKKFDDYCSTIGAKGHDDFASIQALQSAKLQDMTTFDCKEKPGTELTEMKSVVIGYDGKPYLTDGHHSMTQLKEIPDGGDKLKVWVKVNGNYSNIKTADEFWATLVKNGQAWLKDGQNHAITYQQLPKNLGLISTSNPNGMQNNPYRALIYFTRDIGYSQMPGAPDFAEFQWEDWFNKQITNNVIKPLSTYDTDVKRSTAAKVLESTTINADLTVKGSTTSYLAAIANYSLLMGKTNPSEIIYGSTTAAQLGALALQANAPKDSVTAAAISNFNDLTRDEVKKDKSPRSGGSLWYAVKYAECGKPQTNTCWGW